MYEPQFSEGSYGFRPNRSAHGALKQAQRILDEGYQYAVGIDLERFFDTVNQSYLIELLSHTIKDGRVISLIHKYLYAGVMVNGVYQPTPSNRSAETSVSFGKENALKFRYNDVLRMHEESGVIEGNEISWLANGHQGAYKRLFCDITFDE